MTELLVSMALIIFMMTILSEAFATALESFRLMKAAGDMQEKLRSVAIVLRRDLAADHFGPTETRTRLSDMDLSQIPPPPTPYTPPLDGFFRIWQGSAGNYVTDSDNVFNMAPQVTNHWLHFTVNAGNSVILNRLGQKRPENYFAARVIDDVPGGTTSPLLTMNITAPAGNEADFQLRNTDVGGAGNPTPFGLFNSQWAEVVYFLGQTPVGTIPGTNPATNLYALYRRQRAVAVDNTAPNAAAIPNDATNQARYADVSTTSNAAPAPGGNLFFNTLTTLTIPERRFGETSNPGGTPPGTPGGPIANYPQFATAASDQDPYNQNIVRQGDDLLLTDVLSFDVRFMRGDHASPPAPINATEGFIDLFDPALGTLRDGQFNTNITGARAFDTWTIGDATYPAYNTPANNYNSAPGDGVTPGNANHLPTRIRIIALQITIRIWDVKSRQTRQITIVQNM